LRIFFLLFVWLFGDFSGFILRDKFADVVDSNLVSSRLLHHSARSADALRLEPRAPEGPEGRDETTG
jgi:hypothetical protein